MNVDRIVFWIRLFAQVILDVLNALADEPGTGKKAAGGPSQGFKPERIQVWLGIFARSALTAVEGVDAPSPEVSGKRQAGFTTTFKPERIQFWLKLIARFVLAVISELGSEETGKSGEGPRSAAADSRQVDW